MGSSVRLDLRTALPILAVAAIVLSVIVIEFCGRTDVKPLVLVPPGDTATPGETFTPGPSPTPGPPTETPTLGPPSGDDGRDALRVQNLEQIQVALEQYRQDNGQYPSTSNNIQSLCAFDPQDAGCALREVLDPLPQDPLGNPVENGYFYTSDGETYTLYALREGDQAPECGDHPQHLKDLDSLICISGSGP